MSGYTRADVTDQIANGNTVDAIPLDGEFNAVQAAFAAVGGHKHDGSVGEGAPITTIGPTQDVVISGNSITPKTDNTIDLGSSTLEWKNLYIDGVANIDSLVADTADINAGTIDGTVIGGSSSAAITGTTVTATDLITTTATVGGVNVTTASNTQTLTNKTINLANNTLAATSAQLAASVSDETGSGALVFASSPALSGVPTAPTAAANTNTTQIATTAHVFAERSNTATLANKTLTSPVINTATITGGTVSGITDLSVADGGTGASDAAGALLNFGLTATAAELNTLDGITASTAELNILDGVTASAAEINILDGVTASTAELNILDGVTASTAELNILDGATLTVTELNYVDGVTSAIQTQLDAKYDSGDIASQAEAEAGTDNTKVMTPLRLRNALNATGSAPVYACRAWGAFDGVTPSTLAAENISFSRTATGEFAFTFTTAMPDANYSVGVSLGTTSSGFGASIVQGKTSGGFGLIVNRIDSAIARANPTLIHISVFR